MGITNLTVTSDTNLKLKVIVTKNTSGSINNSLIDAFIKVLTNNDIESYLLRNDLYKK